MKAPKQALLLVGSPKPGESTSESLGAYLLDELEKRGVKSQTLHVAKAVRSDESVAELRAAVAAADLVVFSFPLYVDSLPAPAIRVLELIAADHAAGVGADGAGDRAFVTICQSGFPEVDHNEVAMEICRNFARAAGFGFTVHHTDHPPETALLALYAAMAPPFVATRELIADVSLAP